MQKLLACISLCFAFASSAASAQKEVMPLHKPSGLENTLEYYKQAEALAEFRKSRQVSMAQINAMMLEDKNTVLLDTRGNEDYARLHIRGAKHLSYADMTTDRLVKMFPDKSTRIIVYCDSAIMSPLTRMMPLSTNAFVDLHMYGYTNIYEMRSAMHVQPHQQQCQEILDIPFEGDAAIIAAKKQAAVQCLSSY